MFTEPRFHQKDESTDSQCLVQSFFMPTTRGAHYSKQKARRETHAESLSLLLPERELQHYMNGEPGIFSKHFSFIWLLERKQRIRLLLCAA